MGSLLRRKSSFKKWDFGIGVLKRFGTTCRESIFSFKNHSTLLLFKLLPEVPVQVHLPLLEFIFSFKNHSTPLVKLLPKVPVEVHLPRVHVFFFNSLHPTVEAPTWSPSPGPSPSPRGCPAGSPGDSTPSAGRNSLCIIGLCNGFNGTCAKPLSWLNVRQAPGKIKSTVRYLMDLTDVCPSPQYQASERLPEKSSPMFVN